MGIRVVSLIVAIVLFQSHSLHAEVLMAGEAGFQIKVVRTTSVDPTQLDRAVVQGVGDWWHPAHTFSGDASNLTMDLENRRFNESLPGGGFVTHLEITHYKPGARIRLTGGLGPLQEMGLQGALTMQWIRRDGKTEVTLTYNVSGYSPGGLRSLAPVVEQVLAEQLDRLCAHCEELGAR